MASSMETGLPFQLRAEEREPQAMSAEELRGHLFHSLQAKGVLSQLKSQLRCRLVQELKHSGEATEQGATLPLPLALQVANSIVAEHLQVCGYEYTLSTFLPESHTSLDKLLSREDLLRYLQVQPSSPHFTALSEDSGRGFLRDWLESTVVGVALHSHTHSTGVQTEDEGVREPLSLEARLQALDKCYTAQLEGGEEGGERSVGEMVQGWRRECEEQMRRQMDREMEEFKERELSQVREEERKRCERELHNLRIEQEDKHQKKMESLRRLELDTMDRLRRKELETEAALHSKRQELQQQLLAVGNREEQLRRDVEMNRQAIGLAEQRVVAAVEQVAARERQVEEYGQQQQRTFRDWEGRCHSGCKVELETKEAELAGWEARLKAEQGQQETVQAELRQVKEQVREERERREEVQALLHEASRRLVELQRQKEEMQKSLEKMSDHGQMKKQISELRAQVAKSQRQLSESRSEYRRMQAEQHEVIRGLRKQLGRPNKDQLHILEEAEQVKRECQLKLTEAEEEKRQLRRELSVQASVSAQLRGQLEEQALALREMEREVTDLTAQLGHFQIALLHSGQKNRYMSRKATSPGRVGPSPVPHSHLPSPPPPPHPPHTPHPTDPSSHILSETKAAFVRLEQEADILEKHYQQFHQRLAPRSPPPPLSSLHHHLLSTSLPPLSSTVSSAFSPRMAPTTTSVVTSTVPVSPTTHKPLTITCCMGHLPTTTTISTSQPLTGYLLTATTIPSAHPLTNITSSTGHLLTTTSSTACPLTTTTTSSTVHPVTSTTSLTAHPVTNPTTTDHPLTTYPLTTSSSVQAGVPVRSTPIPLLVHTTQSQVTEAAHMSLDQLWKQPKLTTEVSRSREAFATSPLTSETSLPGEAAAISRPLSQPLPPVPMPSRDETSVSLGPMDMNPPTTVGGVAGEGEKVDPLMLKYMELVMQRREKEKEGGEEGKKGQSPETRDHSQSDHSHGPGLPLLSHTTDDSVTVFSGPEQGDDPFQDW